MSARGRAHEGFTAAAVVGACAACGAVVPADAGVGVAAAVEEAHCYAHSLQLAFECWRTAGTAASFVTGWDNTIGSRLVGCFLDAPIRCAGAAARHTCVTEVSFVKAAIVEVCEGGWRGVTNVAALAHFEAGVGWTLHRPCAMRAMWLG